MAGVSLIFYRGDTEVFRIGCFSGKRIFDDPEEIDCNERAVEQPGYDRIEASAD